MDRLNTEEMKNIVAAHGWPTKNKVGSDGMRAAWLLVQHADHDVKFQRKCLDLMLERLEKGQVLNKNVAYLTDRVAVNEGKPQVYGTQFHTVDGVHQPRPLIDPDDVDKRRKSMGLSTMQEYKELMNT